MNIRQIAFSKEDIINHQVRLVFKAYEGNNKNALDMNTFRKFLNDIRSNFFFTNEIDDNGFNLLLKKIDKKNQGGFLVDQRLFAKKLKSVFEFAEDMNKQVYQAIITNFAKLDKEKTGKLKSKELVILFQSILNFIRPLKHIKVLLWEVNLLVDVFKTPDDALDVNMIQRNWTYILQAIRKYHDEDKHKMKKYNTIDELSKDYDTKLERIQHYNKKKYQTNLILEEEIDYIKYQIFELLYFHQKNNEKEHKFKIKLIKDSINATTLHDLDQTNNRINSKLCESPTKNIRRMGRYVNDEFQSQEISSCNENSPIKLRAFYLKSESLDISSGEEKSNVFNQEAQIKISNAKKIVNTQQSLPQQSIQINQRQSINLDENPFNFTMKESNKHQKKEHNKIFAVDNSKLFLNDRIDCINKTILKGIENNKEHKADNGYDSGTNKLAKIDKERKSLTIKRNSYKTKEIQDNPINYEKTQKSTETSEINVVEYKNRNTMNGIFNNIELNKSQAINEPIKTQADSNDNQIVNSQDQNQAVPFESQSNPEDSVNNQDNDKESEKGNNTKYYLNILKKKRLEYDDIVESGKKMFYNTFNDGFYRFNNSNKNTPREKTPDSKGKKNSNKNSKNSLVNNEVTRILFKKKPRLVNNFAEKEKSHKDLPSIDNFCNSDDYFLKDLNKFQHLKDINKKNYFETNSMGNLEILGKAANKIRKDQMSDLEMLNNYQTEQKGFMIQKISVIKKKRNKKDKASQDTSFETKTKKPDLESWTKLLNKINSNKFLENNSISNDSKGELLPEKQARQPSKYDKISLKVKQKKKDDGSVLSQSVVIHSTKIQLKMNPTNFSDKWKRKSVSPNMIIKQKSGRMIKKNEKFFFCKTWGQKEDESTENIPAKGPGKKRKKVKEERNP